MSRSSGAPAAAGVLLPELLGTPEPAPPVHPRGSRVLRMLARILLWSLIAVGALRGLLPAPDAPGRSTTAGPPDGHHAEAVAVAVAFLREYLTVGAGQAERTRRLGRFTAAGVDLRGSVSIPAGAAQYADLVVASGARPVDGGIEVTVLAHVLQVRAGAFRDGGTLAFSVPLAVRREGIAVTGPPRPTALPAAPGLPLPRPRAAPVELSQAARRVARQAVVALVARDAGTLARLGGERPPAIHPLPPGWRATSVGHAEVAGTARALTARVPVRAQPPSGQADYVVPVHVLLDVGRRGLTVRQVDAGGPG